MNASRTGLLVTLLVAALVQPAASDSCRQEEIDAEGKCPKKQQPPTQLEIQGTNVTGAQVSLDGQPVGPAPLILPAKPGRHLVEVKRNGYASYAAWVEVTQGQRRLVQVTLQPTAKTEGCPAEMVQVPAGTFRMRGAIGTKDLEHEVTLSGYCIDKTEVTVKAYRACVAAKGCSATDLGGRSLPRYCNQADRPDHPVNCVNWNQAAAYCTWIDKRLPTEAEWEYAARGAHLQKYPWGNDAPSAKLLNACGSECAAMLNRDLKVDWPARYDASDGWETTAPVGSFPDGKSPFGVLDMAGNVAEWTADWHGNYAGAAVTNPQGAKTGTLRVVRGGSWHPSGSVHVELRDYRGPTLRDDNLGFRCARGD